MFKNKVLRRIFRNRSNRGVENIT